MSETPSTSRNIREKSSIHPNTAVKSLSQNCPLALLAQTCSRIAPNLVPSGGTTSTNPGLFQLNPSSHGSNVKIAPAPSLHKDPQKIFLSKYQNSQTTVQNPGLFVGQDSKETSLVPLVTPVKIPLTLVGPFYACVGAKGQLAGQNLPEKTNPQISNHESPDLVLVQNATTSTIGNLSNSKASLSQQQSCISIMPPEDLTAKMLQAVPPRQQQITCTQQNIAIPTTCENIQKDKPACVKDEATVQITVPSNTTPENLRQILVLASQTAQKLKNTVKSGPLVIQGQLDTSANKLWNLKTTIPASPRNKSKPKTPRKARTPCRCPNCLKIKSESGKNVEATKRQRVHICCFEQCGREFTKTSHLRAHIRTHTGERPYVCDLPFCDRKFTRSDELLRHRRTHGGVKKFKCSLCSKLFMRSDHLAKHKKTHAKFRKTIYETRS